MAIPETPGERLRQLMKERNVGNSEIAKAAGVHVKTVSQWLNDRFPGGPSEENLRPVAKLLGTSISYIRYGQGSPASALATPHVIREGPELSKQLELLANDFEREMIDAEVDVDFKRYVRARLRDPALLEMYAGGYRSMTAAEQLNDYRDLIQELRGRMRRRVEWLKSQGTRT